MELKLFKKDKIMNYEKILRQAFRNAHPELDLEIELKRAGLELPDVLSDSGGIEGSFVWYKTPQGEKFWSEVSEETDRLREIKPEPYFKNAREGDHVYSLSYGAGVIGRIREALDELYPLAVRFNNGAIDDFTQEGKISTDDLNQTLFYGTENPFKNIDLPPEPKRVIVINGIEIPDISFRNNRLAEVSALPCAIVSPAHEDGYYMGFTTDKIKLSCAYPATDDGKAAAVLHAKALMSVK
jgi:hypothetical protein